MANPIYREMILSMLCRDVMISLGDWAFACDLHVFEYHGYGLILSMDWLSLYDAYIYCSNMIVTLKYLECWERIRIALETIDGYDSCGTLCSLETIMEEISRVSIIRDFADIFESMKGLPPRQAIEFHIYLVPSVSPVSRQSSSM